MPSPPFRTEPGQAALNRPTIAPGDNSKWSTNDHECAPVSLPKQRNGLGAACAHEESTQQGSCCLNWEAIIWWLDELHEAQAKLAARQADPWRLCLERARGQVGDDSVERITTQLLFNILEVPQRSRGAGACRRLAKQMSEIGWMAVRARGPTRGGYLEQVRGYCREPLRRA